MHSGSRKRHARRDDQDTADYGIDTVAANVVFATISYAQWFQRRDTAHRRGGHESYPRSPLCQITEN